MIDTTTFAALNIAEMTQFDCPPALQRQQLRDGTVIDNSVGADLWQAEFTLGPARHGPQQEFETLLRYNTRVGRFMLAHDPRRNGPIADPGGADLSGFTPDISYLDANNRQMQIDGLPVGYVLTVGDYIGWIYSGRYALHRIMTTVTADGTGEAALFEVDPLIRSGATVATPVTLVCPQAKFRVIEMQQGGASGVISEGPTFSMIQTLGPA